VDIFFIGFFYKFKKFRIIFSCKGIYPESTSDSIKVYKSSCFLKGENWIFKIVLGTKNPLLFRAKKYEDYCSF
jgi:hypothetical protein